MHTYKSDCVRVVACKGDRGVAVDIILDAESARQCPLHHDHVLAGVETADGDCANRTRHRLVKYETILTDANRYYVRGSHVNGVVAVANRNNIAGAR
jgi:hypothetical protein